MLPATRKMMKVSNVTMMGKLAAAAALFAAVAVAVAEAEEPATQQKVRTHNLGANFLFS